MATATFKCPNCGGGLLFNPETQKSKCEFCLSEFTNQELAEISAAIEAKARAAAAETGTAAPAAATGPGAGTGAVSGAVPGPGASGAGGASGSAAGAGAAVIGGGAAAFGAAGAGAAASGTVMGGSTTAGTAASAASAEMQTPEHMVGYVCDSCGAEVVTEDTTSATFCYYCHNPVLLTSRLSGVFKPDKIIPFQYTKEKAVSQFLNWAKRRKFVPASFYSAAQLEKITGLYVPYWMASYEAQVDYAAQGTTSRSWVSGNMEYTEIKDFAIERRGVIDVNSLQEIAMKKIDKGLIESVTPFDQSKTVDFAMSYLSGFFAEKYDITKEQVRPTIENRTRTYVATLVRDSIKGYSSVKENRNNVTIAPRSWFYTLFPIWVLTYQYHNKTYIYAVNGQNGKAHGELPVDQQKLSLVSIIIGACLLVLLLLGGLLIW